MYQTRVLVDFRPVSTTDESGNNIGIDSLVVCGQIPPPMLMNAPIRINSNLRKRI